MANKMSNTIQIEVGEWKLPLNTQWKEVNRNTVLKLGRLTVASYCYDGSIPVGCKTKYKVTSPIVGIKTYLGHFETEEEARQTCLKAATTVIRMILDAK